LVPALVLGQNTPSTIAAMKPNEKSAARMFRRAIRSIDASEVGCLAGSSVTIL
jgi:hypothetical protein